VSRQLRIYEYSINFSAFEDYDFKTKSLFKDSSVGQLLPVDTFSIISDSLIDKVL